MIASTVSALNITNLAELAAFCYSANIDFEFWPVTDPDVLSLKRVNKSVMMTQIEKLAGLLPNSKKNKIQLGMLLRQYLSNVSLSCPLGNDPQLEEYISYLNTTRSKQLNPKNLTLIPG